MLLYEVGQRVKKYQEVEVMGSQDAEGLVRGRVWSEGRREGSRNFLFVLPGDPGHVFQMVIILFVCFSF